MQSHGQGIQRRLGDKIRRAHCGCGMGTLPVSADLDAQYKLNSDIPFKAAEEPMNTIVPDLLLRK